MLPFFFVLCKPYGLIFFETLFFEVETSFVFVETFYPGPFHFFASTFNTQTFITMQRIVKISGLVFALIAAGCSTQSVTSEQAEWKPTYRVQLGTNKGGVVENTDLTVIPNTEVDAYSGATSSGINASAKVILPLKRNAIETGVDLMYNKQTFSYADATNSFNGERKLDVYQFMVPITYSIGVLKKNNSEGLFQIKLGYVAQLNSINVSNIEGNLPQYSTSLFSNGATIGISSTPFKLSNGAKIGFYLDGYRGSQVYEDFYNRTDFEMPGTAFVKYGIIYQF